MTELGGLNLEQPVMEQDLLELDRLAKAGVDLHTKNKMGETPYEMHRAERKSLPTS